MWDKIWKLWVCKPKAKYEEKALNNEFYNNFLQEYL